MGHKLLDGLYFQTYSIVIMHIDSWHLLYCFPKFRPMLLKALKGVFAVDKRIPLNLRNHSLIAAFVCSGAAYRLHSNSDLKLNYSVVKVDPTVYASSTFYSLIKNISPHGICSCKNNELESDSSSDRESESRFEKMLFIRNWIIDELPAIFSKGIFNTVDLFCPETVLEIERSNCQTLYFR